MIYKRPVITLTSLLDLLFILIFAYQIEIKTNADKFVQAEVSRGVDQNIKVQKELIAELQAENRRVKDELEYVREKAESATKNAYEYKSQSEKYETQRDLLREKIAIQSKRIKDTGDNELQAEELKNELKRKERELLAVKQEKERIKKQTKSEGVIPITDKDAELAKALVGTWRGSDAYRWLNRSYRTTHNPDNTFIDYSTKTAIEDVIVGGLSLKKGDSTSVNLTGAWWVKDGYIHYFVKSSSNTKAIPIGHSSSSKILSVDSNIFRFRNDDGSISTNYRIR